VDQGASAGRPRRHRPGGPSRGSTPAARESGAAARRAAPRGHPRPEPAESTRPRRRVPAAPEPDEDATLAELDRATRAQLRTLPAQLADDVGRHLVMVGRLLEEDPQTAYLHAAKAQALASRVSVVREALGLAAYRTGRWAQALAELRAARRMGGHDDLVPLIADCERALGRPERALALAGDPAVARLDEAGRVEMLIVGAGARRDLGQPEAAVLALQVKELTPPVLRPWTARLRFAYADALAAVGRDAEARRWFAAAVEADVEGETDAALRLAEMDGIVVEPPGPDPGVVVVTDALVDAEECD